MVHDFTCLRDSGGSSIKARTQWSSYIHAALFTVFGSAHCTLAPSCLNQAFPACWSLTSSGVSSVRTEYAASVLVRFGERASSLSPRAVLYATQKEKPTGSRPHIAAVNSAWQ
ncbi:hypothetical protein DPEC_G00104350 [Dallia pectoralis]|uniref:Uncharacterized protein n=1 Tax=Dallia pectoralis TaxID=75939 RepID=A0ACC2GYJ3_DALPE|nr:hypothetical protein DPEC_G00104350 [Dallia pectoralis]